MHRHNKNMELNIEKKSSQDLLSCGKGGGLQEKLLLKPRSSSSLQTARVPRSSVLDRLQSFLPQMAEANEKLKQQIDQSPADSFNIECVEDAEKVIEMDVALVELSGSDSDPEDTSEDEDLASEEENEITEENLKLPSDNNCERKANIQVLDV